MTVINACGFGIPNTKPISTLNYNAISVASSQTGADNATMFAIADLVSGFDSDAVLNGGTGLYNFLPTTWDEMMTQYSYKYKIPDYSDSITNPLYNAYMGAQFILDVIAILKRDFGIATPTAGEIYITFFMGISGGPQLIELKNTNPTSAASLYFPAFASKNKSIFFNSDGTSKTLLEVYNIIVGIGDKKAIAYANQTFLDAPCLRGKGTSGYEISTPNTPSGKINADSPISSCLKFIGTWVGGNTVQESHKLVQVINNLPDISKWVAGAGNLVLNPPAIGTAIGTFGLDGTYGKIAETAHSGIYLGKSEDGSGLKVLDQWGVSTYNPQGLRTDIRDILSDTSKGYVNYALHYHVINIIS